MKKTAISALFAAGLAASLLLSGCSKSKDGNSTAAEGTISGYLVENADKYVKLGTYTGIPVDEVVYEVTDDDVLMEIDNRLMTSAALEEVDTPAEFGDTLSLNFTVTPAGEASTSYEDYSIEIGMQDLGEEFDNALLGHRKGDTFDAEINYDELAMNEDWANKKVSFHVTVNSVATTSVPDLDDAFVKANTEYNTVEEYTAAVKEELTATFANDGKQLAYDSLLSDAVSASTFTGYPDATYDALSDQVHTGYEHFAESMGLSIDELYEYYDITKDDVENEILSQVNLRLFISALCQKENLALTDETYKEFLSASAAENGYDDTGDFEKDYGKASLIWDAYNNLACEFLYKNAKVTQTVSDYSSDDLGIDLSDDAEGETALEIDGLAE